MLVFTCTDGDEATSNNLGGDAYPVCESGGAWVQVEAYSGTEFDPSEFDAARAAEAFSAGVLVMGTGMVIALAISFIVRQVWDWR